MGLETRIWALRLGFGPQDWDLGLETKIWASRLGFEGGMKKKEEKIPMCVKALVIDSFGAAAQKGQPQTNRIALNPILFRCD